jgi:hypothetical protein
VSHFALLKLHDEYKASQSARQNMNCICGIKFNYGLQCRHNFPMKLSLEDIDEFWHLKKKQGTKE